MKDPECRVQFYDYTLYYPEEYAGSFVDCYRIKFRDNTEFLQRVQAVLEYMVNQGSQIAFFGRRNLIGKEWNCGRSKKGH